VRRDYGATLTRFTYLLTGLPEVYDLCSKIRRVCNESFVRQVRYKLSSRSFFM